MILQERRMRKSDKIIEILARICAIVVIIFCAWINYELNIPCWDGMRIADKGCSQVILQ